MVRTKVESFMVFPEMSLMSELSFIIPINIMFAYREN